MVKFLINRPIAVIMTLIGFLVLGVITASRMPVSLLPPVNIPEITVRISYPGSDARRLENAVVKKVRQQLLQVNHLKDINSETRDGIAVIKLRFAYNTDIHLAYIETNEKIDGIMETLPRDMERPEVMKASASDIPVFYVSVVPDSSYWNKNNDLIQLSIYTQNVLKKRIEQLSEVAMVDISGLEYPEIVITPRKERLESLNLTNADIERTLKQNNISLGNILIKDGQYLYNVRISAELKTVDDIANLYLNAGNRLIQLKEIASIKIKPKQRKGLYLAGTKEAIVMAVIKQADAQMSVMHTELHTLIKQLKKENPGLEIRVSRDRSELLNYSMKNLKQTLLLGLLLSIIVMFFFMRDVKAPLLTGISIPAALIISLFFLYLANISINIVSISGLILGVGMMIDNSIIVIDNITQYRRKGVHVNSACIQGTNEVIRPLLSSVLTTIAVFVPLVFLSDISGALFFDQAVTVSVSLFVSLLVSIMILPVFYRLFYKKTPVDKNEKEFGNFETKFENGVLFVIRKKMLFLLLFALLVPAGFFLFKEIEKRFMPETKQTGFNVVINWNEPVDLKESKKRIITVFSNLSIERQAEDAFVGESQFVLEHSAGTGEQGAELYFKTASVNDAVKLKKEISDFFEKNYPDASIDLKPEKNVFTMLFSGEGAPLVANIRSSDRNSPPEINDVKKLIADISQNTTLLNKNPLPEKTVINISLNFQKLTVYNVEYNRVVDKLETLFGRNKAGVLKSGKSFIDIIISEKGKDIYTILQNAEVQNREKKSINLLSLINVEKNTSYRYINADRQGEYIPVPVEASMDDYKTVQKRIESFASTLPGLEVTFSGELFKDIGLFKELIIVLIISVLLLFFILAAQFESVVQPVIVLTEIFLDIAGALIVLIIFGSSLNVMSAIGIIVMSGIIINDSILKIDTINHYYKNGMPLLEAISIGGKRRVKPILMTSITTILALVPLLFFTGLGVELQLPLALSIIGGMFFGTIVSLYFIPLLYYIIHSIRK